MKKRLLAMLCVLSVLVGVFVFSATTATATEETFQVGYAKVDINPYYTDGDPNSGIMPVPLRGTGTSATRLAYKMKMDDNGDGKVDKNDGLFLTCIAITDSTGNTVLLYTMDAIGDMGHTTLARETICQYVTESEYGIKELDAAHIMVTGTHAHGSVDLSVLSSYRLLAVGTEDGDTVLDADGNSILGTTANECLREWKYRLIGTHEQNNDKDNYFVQAAKEALDNRAAATVKKGSIEATDASGKVMNSVRHYITKDENNNETLYIYGDNFNPKPSATKYYQDEVSDIDQTLHAVSFEFTNGNAPIALINWRCHPSLNSAGSGDRIVTSDYINAFRYLLGQEKNGGYRVAFFQGAGGNNNPASKVPGANGISNGNWITENPVGVECTRGNTYGKALAQVAKTCLTNNMTDVAAGEIQTMQNKYAANKVVYTDAEKAAANEAYTANQNGKWPQADDKKTTFDESKMPFKASNGICIGSTTQMSRIRSYSGHKEGETIELEINTLLIGPKLAIVTCPGEPFDRYSLTAAEELEKLIGHDFGTVTVKQYTAITNKYNDWDKLNTYNAETNSLGVKNAEYGEPLVFGYANQHVYYIPNAVAYTYHVDNYDDVENRTYSDTYGFGSYGTHMTPLAKGEGEKMVANLATMLNEMVNGRTEYCSHCDEDVLWYDLKDFGVDEGYSYSHYYLSEDLPLTATITLTDKDICLDLNGNTLTGHPRAFLLQGTTKLNVVDTSGKNGQVIGTFVKQSQSGGAISIDVGCELNIYGGTFSYDDTNGNAAYGAVIWNKGTINVYNGKILGGSANNKGGAICMHDEDSRLNVYGGEITAGSAELGGNCVASRNGDGIVTVSGNAKVAGIYYVNGPATSTFMIVDSPADKDAQTPFSGSVTLDANGITIGTIVGSASVSIGPEASVTVSNGLAVEKNKDNQLVAVGEAGVVLGKETTYYKTLTDAVANVGKGYVILSKNIDNATIDSDVTIDLNGKTITTLNAASGITVKLKDRMTDDYDCDDGNYGKVVNISGNVTAVEGYLLITDAEEGTSAHAYHMELKSVTLSSKKVGIYYKSEFLGDRMVAQKIDSFGVALNITSEPNQNNMKPGTYSVFTKEDFGGVNTSTTLVNIMKTATSVSTNAKNAELPVYGRAYIKFADGSYQFTESAHYSLRELAELIDRDYWAGLTLEQKNDVIEMYRKFSAVMGSWDIENIKAEYQNRVDQAQKAEDETLKVIILGSSYSLDSYHLLYDVIQAEGIPADATYNGKAITSVELGVMYHGGCYMYEHADFAKNNSPEYTYYKIGEDTDGQWVTQKKSTLKQGLTDEKWDVVVLQESNMATGIANDEHSADTQYVVNYVKRTLGYTPKFMWNMTWSNPEVPAGTYSTAAEYRANKWIYKVSDPGGGVEGENNGDALKGINSWETRMQSYFGNDAQTQHNKMVYNVQKYIAGRYGISEDNVVTPGTTIMYALNNTIFVDNSDYRANEQIMYRDYTHLSDTSRVMVSYLWYAELFGLDEIDSVNYSVIPANMRATDKTADVILTTAMKNNIIAAVNYTLDNPYGQYTGQ